ncbi:hypothetical protein [Clostridium beijerinckii]|uniref:hypothetical protein n=1 Tax=Clostridium beijerinckii TaxID=1520 RepID=UPI00098CC60B|nr:hypothetical protein [Clostridium beijerinckii]MBA8935925.1 hypothetical protein [Clostridium beijerinckii]NRU35997.1 hypothetical protein [Clostridium beijerinckii]NSB00722.1 hypothetical protein [Clostridium beijerinckii]OOM53886.1 hypothetical protein CLOBI_49420 [Clostridium beijerinckii]OOM66961.1 hypothetical protein CLBEIC_44980 [Clostridium beijerinckii]
MKTMLTTNQSTNAGVMLVLDPDKLNVKKLRSEIDYCDFLSYIIEREELEEDMAIITVEEWNDFYALSRVGAWEEDRDIEMKYVSADNFYNEGFNMTSREFAKAFVSLEELEGYENDEYIIVIKLNIEGVERSFVIDGGM